MNKKMLIDASYKEEMRVVILNGNSIEDYDVESATKKQLKGNIYLAKVIRIEPSLQAAFVEYGGNRHGFLAFSEIHPDYYQIPIADRKELLDLQSAEKTNTDQDDDLINNFDQQNMLDEDQHPASQFLKRYKIQEVIHRRQVLLVQVVKEERGNKGAALTTYLSLAGRYCVLMPNSLRSGGISRKITSPSERRRLKDIIEELNIPSHMGMIIRTAGAQCPKADALKDGEYLLHLWDEIRDRTMKAIAPTLIYEDSNLLKRSIRDNYTSDINEILIDGEEGWTIAKEYMRSLMPQNIRKLHLWRDQKQSLFSYHKVENLINEMLSPTVQLKSGGYLVINQTEALVAIDVNSGRSIKEKDLEETALRTNQEAADEIVRQLKLRDLAGLIVIDFIDMENKKHNYMVERRLKAILHKDRARIQIGSISSFGLLEMTRQRLRPSIAEFAYIPCPHCNGNGLIHSETSVALQILRQIDEEARKLKPGALTVYVSSNEIALYILNQKRNWLSDIEKKRRIHVILMIDEKLQTPQIRFHHEIDESIDIEDEVETPIKESLINQSEFLVQTSPFIREIPIQSHSDIEEDNSDDDKEYNNNKRRHKRPRYNNHKNQKENITTLDIEEFSGEITHSPKVDNEQPEVPFHPVINQDEYFASKPQEPRRQHNRRSRYPRWKQKQPVKSFDNQNEDATVITVDVVPTVSGNDLTLPISENVKNDQSSSFVAIDISDVKSHKNEAVVHKSLEYKPNDTTSLSSNENQEQPAIISEESIDEKKHKPTTRRTSKTKVSTTTKARKTTKVVNKEKTATAEDNSENATAEVEKPKRVTRGRKKATSQEDEDTASKKAKPSTRKTPLKTKKKVVSKNNNEENKAVVQPIVIDETAPSPAPRAGWWKRS